METKQVQFTPGDYAKMKANRDVETVTFIETYEKILDHLSSASKILGNYDSLKPLTKKTPVPCLASWSLSQMFQTTPCLQQCVKMVIEAKSEYFFIMTERINDQHSWIYLHQQRNSLCIHRLDKTGREDELDICADNLAEMDDLSDFTEMYVCTNYIKDERKLRIQVGRPNYNSRDLEAATIILSVSIMINEDENEGPPRYYSVASGSHPVIVRNLYVTNLDRVTCTGKYEKVTPSCSTGTYQACDILCHDECAVGCNTRLDPKSCNACENHSLFYTDSRFECVSSCDSFEQFTEVALDEAGQIRQKTGSVNISESTSGITTYTVRKAWMEGDITCRLCHEECNFGCKGSTNKDCISLDPVLKPWFKDCKTVQYGLEFGRCLSECPSGFFIKADPDYENINVCAACHPACQECLGHFTEEEDPTKHAPASEDGYKECCGTVCSNGYFRVHNGLDKMKCVKSCPDGFYKTPDNRCEEKWTTIAFQSEIFDNNNYTKWSLTRGTKTEPMSNFWNLGLLLATDTTYSKVPVEPESTDIRPFWTFKMEWQLENEILGQLIWEQRFAADQPDMSLTVDTTADIELKSFDLLECNEKSDGTDIKLNLSYAHEWRNCASGQARTQVVAATDLTNVLSYFKGIIINRFIETTDASLPHYNDGDIIPVFPVVKTFSATESDEHVFFSFGQDWKYRGSRFPAFIIPSTKEFEYAESVRLSVFDTRIDPTLTQWGEWTACETCGREQPKSRARECVCSGNEGDCFPCVEVTEETGFCDTTACAFGDYSDMGACSFHAKCCQTVSIKADKFPVDGVYSRLYSGVEPFATYKRVGEEFYLHYDTYKSLWVISNGYWIIPPTIYFKSTPLDSGTVCPNDVQKWIFETDGQLTDLIVACDDIFGYRCPASHPFVYNDGNDCCKMPFEDVDDNYGSACDASPINLESKCCLNAADDTSMTTTCKSKGCVNYQGSEQNATDSFFFPISDGQFYKYKHRGCTGEDIEDCGNYKELTLYEICPNWLTWNQWSVCETNERILTPNDDDKGLFYDTYNRTRYRDCNTGNLTDCLTEPGLNLVTENVEDCVHWMSWNIWSEYLTPDSSSDHSTDVPASCYRGKRFRERKCTENPDLFGANCRSAPNCLMLNDVKSCCFCDSELAKLHITFSIEDNDIPHEIEWEDRTEYQTDNISSCEWSEWGFSQSFDTSTSLLSGYDFTVDEEDGWISDCSTHENQVGFQQRTRVCRSDKNSDVTVGQPLCAVNLDDLSSDKDFSRKCIGASEVLYLEGTVKKHCEKIIEKQSIFCPYWTQWTECPVSCSWKANKDRFGVSAILTTEQLDDVDDAAGATRSTYAKIERDGDTELPGSDQDSFTQSIYAAASFDDTAFITRTCVIGPNGMQTVLDKSLWYLCRREEIPTVADLRPNIDVISAASEPVPGTLVNPLFKKVCNFVRCPSWTEWRTSEVIKSRHGDIPWNGCGEEGVSSTWTRHCTKSGEIGYFKDGVASLNKPSGDCVGSAILIKSDCPAWSNWAVDINKCGKPGKEFVHEDKLCNKNAVYWDFRSCRINLAVNRHNPRGDDVQDIDCGPTTPGVTKEDYQRATSMTGCGVDTEKIFFDCFHGPWYDSEELLLMLLLAAALLAALMLHLLFHFG